MRTYTLIAAGIGTLLLGLAAGAPAHAKLATNGESLNGIFQHGLRVNGVGLAAPAQGELGTLEVLSVTLPPAKAG
jgi:hypothetical protein